MGGVMLLDLSFAKGDYITFTCWLSSPFLPACLVLLFGNVLVTHPLFNLNAFLFY
jgi:hypothetical protein